MRLVVLTAVLIACQTPTLELPPEIASIHALSALRSDGTFIYYMDDANANIPNSPSALRLMRVGVNGGTPTPLGNVPTPTGIGGTDDDLVPFVIDSSTAFCPIKGAIYTIPLSGGTATTLVDEGATMSIVAITMDDEALYWLEGPLGLAFGTRVVRIPKGGGVPVVLSDESAVADRTREIAVDATQVYWAASSDRTSVNDSIAGTPIAAGSTAIIAANQQMPIAVARGDDLYWVNEGANQSQGAIVKLSLPANSSPVVLVGNLPIALPSSATNPTLIAVVGDTPFWNDLAGVHGYIDGQVRTFVTGPVDLFTVDSSSVYWSTDVGVFRAPLQP